MDILRKELNQIYQGQQLRQERLPLEEVMKAREVASQLVCATQGCAVITDAAADKCYVYSSFFGELMGYENYSPSAFEADSSDEDVIYDLIHPEDLVDKRLLEYEFFKCVENVDFGDRTSFIARCSIRMRDKAGDYRTVENTTQLIRLSPAGKIWLILCTYSLSTRHFGGPGIFPAIINSATGEVSEVPLGRKRQNILSPREKEILLLIRDGKLSKQIAAALNISINTVNRHRQNILEKLSVGNSVEAVAAATLMNLF